MHQCGGIGATAEWRRAETTEGQACCFHLDSGSGVSEVATINEAQGEEFFSACMRAECVCYPLCRYAVCELVRSVAACKKSLVWKMEGNVCKYAARAMSAMKTMQNATMRK